MKKTFKQFLTENYTFTIFDIEKVWEDINAKLFDDKLKRPKFRLEDDLNYLVPEEHRPENAYILGYCDQDNNKTILRFCTRIDDPEELIAVIAHEMVHQSLAEKHGYEKMVDIDHGPDFMAYAPLLKNYHNIVLSKTLGFDE